MWECLNATWNACPNASSTPGGSDRHARWVGPTVLRSAGAQDTYLRTYRGALDTARVVQFLRLA
jgi:uncharacterized alpha-E superfamily protein